ncbi:MAG: hypothetical protein GY799_23030 [Desulfobulbaceae bacterium]|nr:hypothetical protein [Desulfobulbaceae bacterium]
MSIKDKESSDSAPPKPATRVPWWVSVLMAIGSYCCLKFIVPGLHLEDPTLQKLSQAAPSFAPLVTIPFLLLAAKQLYDSDIGEEGNNTLQDDQRKDSEE